MGEICKLQARCFNHSGISALEIGVGLGLKKFGVWGVGLKCSKRVCLTLARLGLIVCHPEAPLGPCHAYGL